MFQAEDKQTSKLTPHQQLWRNVKVLPVKKKLQPDDFIEKTFSEYLSCHPTYVIPLIRAHNYILREIGPLNQILRHFIAIMAASRHRCTFLINYSKKEFLFNGGDPDWLRGLQYVPPKVRALSQINKVLAHQPWLFQKSHISSLVKGQIGWSLSELTHAIIIMAHFHCLCTLAYGCKFGYSQPENFEDDDDNSVEVEIEELRFDPDFGPQKVKKVVKRSPAALLIAERCRQLEQENATLAKFMNIKAREKYGSKEVNSNSGNANSKERLQKQDSIGSQRSQTKKTKEKNKENSKNGNCGNGLEEGQAIPNQEKTQTNNKQRNRKSSNSSNSTSSSVSNSPSSLGSQSMINVSKSPSEEMNSKFASSANNSSNKTVTKTTASVTSPIFSAGEGTSAQPQTPAKSPPSPATTEESSASSGADFKENNWSEDEFKKNNYDVLVDDNEFCYVDFSSRGRPAEVSTFRFQDYGWDDQGYSLSNLLYPDISPYLDEKFKVGYNLTYYTLGPKTNIDTSPFRRAVWNYIQCVYGMRHDDYNYRDVNILIERNLKWFIKCLSCYPETVVKHDFSDVMKGFRASEKIHVIIMVTEARLQCELLYALRSITEFMKGTS